MQKAISAYLKLPRPALTGALVALVAGAIAPLALAPFNLWPLAYVSLILLVFCLQDLSPRQALLRGWLYGVGLYGVGASWVYVSIHDYGYAPIPLALILTLIFVCGLAFVFSASFAWVYARLLANKPLGAVLGFPALWVLFEWLRSWFLTGFPWLFLGYGHTDNLLGAWAPVTGVYGLSFIVALSSALIFAFISGLAQGRTKSSTYKNLTYRNSTYKSLGLLALLAIPWLLAWGLDRVAWTEALEQPLRATLLQPNVTQDKKWLPEQRPKTLAYLEEQSLAGTGADLILWPENAVPAFYHQASGYLERVAAALAARGTALITGIPYSREDEKDGSVFHNSIVAMGTGSGVYHKQKLVPFGEYVPMQTMLRGLIAFFDLPMSNFRPGPKDQDALRIRLQGQSITIAPYICYEIVYPDFARALAAKSNLLLTISDDSWFGESIGPQQHLQMARMRAMENGRSLLRATNTGITASIDAKGRILAQAKPFTATGLNTQVTLYSGSTPFNRWGSWPLLASCLALLAWLVPSGVRPHS